MAVVELPNTERRRDIRLELSTMGVDDDIVLDVLQKIRARRMLADKLTNRARGAEPTNPVLEPKQQQPRLSVKSQQPLKAQQPLKLQQPQPKPRQQAQSPRKPPRPQCEDEVETFRIEFQSDAAVPGEAVHDKHAENSEGDKYVERYQMVPHMHSKTPPQKEKIKKAQDDDSVANNTKATNETQLTDVPEHLKDVFASKTLETQTKEEEEAKQEALSFKLNEETLERVLEMCFCTSTFSTKESTPIVQREKTKNEEDEDNIPMEIEIKENTVVAQYLAARIQRARDAAQRKQLTESAIDIENKPAVDTFKCNKITPPRKNPPELSPSPRSVRNEFATSASSSPLPSTPSPSSEIGKCQRVGIEGMFNRPPRHPSKTNSEQPGEASNQSIESCISYSPSKPKKKTRGDKSVEPPIGDKTAETPSSIGNLVSSAPSSPLPSPAMFNWPRRHPTKTRNSEQLGDVWLTSSLADGRRNSNRIMSSPFLRRRSITLAVPGYSPPSMEASNQSIESCISYVPTKPNKKTRGDTPIEPPICDKTAETPSSFGNLASSAPTSRLPSPSSTSSSTGKCQRSGIAGMFNWPSRHPSKMRNSEQPGEASNLSIESCIAYSPTKPKKKIRGDKSVEPPIGDKMAESPTSFGILANSMTVLLVPTEEAQPNFPTRSMSARSKTAKSPPRWEADSHIAQPPLQEATILISFPNATSNSNSPADEENTTSDNSGDGLSYDEEWYNYSSVLSGEVEKAGDAASPAVETKNSNRIISPPSLQRRSSTSALPGYSPTSMEAHCIDAGSKASNESIECITYVPTKPNKKTRGDKPIEPPICDKTAETPSSLGNLANNMTVLIVPAEEVQPNFSTRSISARSETAKSSPRWEADSHTVQQPQEEATALTTPPRWEADSQTVQQPQQEATALVSFSNPISNSVYSDEESTTSNSSDDGLSYLEDWYNDESLLVNLETEEVGSDDTWLVNSVMKRYAKTQNISVDDLIEDICDKLDALDMAVFYPPYLSTVLDKEIDESSILERCLR